MDTEQFTVRVDLTVEPFSGMELYRVTGWWQGEKDEWRGGEITVRYDGETAIRSRFTSVKPTGMDDRKIRYEFGTQLPTEENVRELTVVYSCNEIEYVIYRQDAVAIRSQLIPPKGRNRLPERVWKSIISGEIISPWRWQARVSRLAEKLIALRQKVRYKLLSRKYRPRDPYQSYVESTLVGQKERDAMLLEGSKFAYRPKISILVPVYNVDPRWLKKAIDSVINQTYTNWELCLADDNSTNKKLQRYLQHLPNDRRIKLVRRTTNGHICQASNSAADLATGEFVALLDHDDELAPDALFWMVEKLQSERNLDVIYSDEDKIDEKNRRYDPQFKPDWSPELLLSYNYINHFTMVRKSIFEKVNRFRVGLEGSQDHDLLLRVTEHTDRVGHIQRVLYHWRSLDTSTASAAGVKEYVHSAGRKAVEDALIRRGVQATLYVPQFAKQLGLPVLALDGTQTDHSVCVVVYGETRMCEKTVEIIRKATTFPKLDYCIVDVTDNIAEALNEATINVNQDYILFLEAGLIPKDTQWLSRMVAYLELKGVGGVGTSIRNEKGEIIHSGILMGMRDGTWPCSAFDGARPDSVSYYFYAESARNVSAISGSCMLIRKDLFHKTGRFRSQRYPTSLWDVDYCIRLLDIGWRIVVVPDAEVESRRITSNTASAGAVRELYADHGRRVDHYYNSNCSDWQSWQPSIDCPLPKVCEWEQPPIKALVIAHNLNNTEGAPRYLSEIILGLFKRQFINPTIWSAHDGPGSEVYNRIGIPVVVAELDPEHTFTTGDWSPRDYEKLQSELVKIINVHQPEIVIANTINSFPFVDAAIIAGIPTAWIIHESYSQAHLTRLYPQFTRNRILQTLSLATRVIPASHATAEVFSKHNVRGNMRVIHNGLDPRPFDNYIKSNERRVRHPVGTKNIICVGTVCERKGQHTLIEAASILIRETSDFHITLIGCRKGIPYADYIYELIRRYQLNEHVTVVEETDDVWQYYLDADIYVCTSHMETFSRAILEAEAFGLPIISTRACGVSEQVIWGSGAVAYDMGDANGLAVHLHQLLIDTDLRNKMAFESRATFDTNLNYNEMLDRYAMVIQSATRLGPLAATQSSINLLMHSYMRGAA